ncbi:hypothetical protein PV325_005440 [Microctonus aethiopoides]|nr:hypothetical protein PV326_014380 [Microctonus aethiopoides]KAK0076415.1 hypothetical protein PV325_005440 [Microctonus aethiopoides]
MPDENFVERPVCPNINILLVANRREEEEEEEEDKDDEEEEEEDVNIKVQRNKMRNARSLRPRYNNSRAKPKSAIGTTR